MNNLQNQRFLRIKRILPAPFCILLILLAVSARTTGHQKELSVGDKKILQLLDRDCPILRIWPEAKAPDEINDPGEEKTEQNEKNVTRLHNVTNPTITIVEPRQNKNGTAVVVCPGGGYNILAIDLEGTEIVKWLNSMGVTAVLLKYRVPRRGGSFPRRHHALQDAQRAMSIVRSRAEQWGIDPNRIGICGFSAGGHLAAMLSHTYETRKYEQIDDIDNTSPRPDFAILVYPAYLTEPARSWNLAEEFTKPAKGTIPPTFLAVSGKDRFINGTIRYCRELTEAGAEAECHIYFKGEHGVGLRKEKGYPLSEWTASCRRWLKDHNYLKKGP